jgi:CheY-like chemotaxis protein
MRQSILLVDDDKDDCNFLHDSLIQIGVKLPIVFVHDGPSVFRLLESLNENLPKLIILDVNMPLMNGMVVLAKLNKEYKIPVILYTTSCSDEIIREAKANGAIDCVKKGTSYVDNLKFAKRVSELVRNLSLSEY